MRIEGITSNIPTKAVVNDKDADGKSVKAGAIKDSVSEERAAVVFKSGDKTADNNVKIGYKPDEKMVAKLISETEARMEQLKSLVERMILNQGKKFKNSAEMYEALRDGKLNVDPATAAQAQAEISEDGFWGVEQTSDRMVSFAKALTGGDPAKGEEMKAAFIKGFEEAKKAWGGALPSICNETYDATIKKFDEWIAGGK
ncbi:MAG: hypothetical protein ACOX4U_06685 [Anaerovoracaceae bacterium]|jgi:hypothetical protein